MSRDGVEVVLPSRAPAALAPELIAEKRRWIDRALLKTERARAGVAGRRLADGELLPVLDSAIKLRITSGNARSAAKLRSVAPSTAQLDFEQLARQVAGRPDIVVGEACRTLEVATTDGSPKAVFEAIERWYRSTARREIGRRLDAAVARHDLAYSGLSIRGQKTRWASCSAKGRMSFNWRLLLAPGSVLDYVVEHEVAHLEVMDHSDRFWRLVAERRPSFESERRWLREHGDMLFL